MKGWENGGDHLRWEDVTKASLNTQMTAGAKAKKIVCEDRFSFSFSESCFRSSLCFFVFVFVFVFKSFSLVFAVLFQSFTVRFCFIHIGFLSFFTSFFRWPDS